MSRFTKSLENLGRAWTVVAVMVFNAIVLFLLLNLGVLGIESVRGAKFGGYFEYNGNTEYHPNYERLKETYTESVTRRIFPDLTQQEALNVITASWAGDSVYDAYVQFRPAELESEYVNVHEIGFRSSGEELPWPPKSDGPVIFVFGGSTTFGIGIRDYETIPAYLGTILSAEGATVYNFGRSSYFSTQERILFELLLAEGFVPDIAVFIDGLNEFYHWDGEPEFTQQLSQLFDEAEKLNETAAARALERVPIMRAMYGSDAKEKRRLARRPLMRNPEVTAPPVITRYLANLRLIRTVAAAYEVTPLFIWQPAPFYELRGEYLFDDITLAPYKPMRAGYTYFSEHPEVQNPAPDFVWLADANDDIGVPLYVDTVHYTPAYAKVLAAAIAPHVQDCIARRSANSIKP